jgi:hypothetical protein
MARRTTKPIIWNTLDTGLAKVTILQRTSFHNHLDNKRRTTIHTIIATSAAIILALSPIEKCSLDTRKVSTVFLTADNIFFYIYKKKKKLPIIVKIK